MLGVWAMNCLKCFIIGSWVKFFRAMRRQLSQRPPVNYFSFNIASYIALDADGVFRILLHTAHCSPEQSQNWCHNAGQPYSANRAAKEKQHKFHRTITVSLRICGLIIVHVHPAMPCQREKFMTPSSRGASKSYKRELFYLLLRVASIFCYVAYFRSLNNFLSFSTLIYMRYF